MSRYDQDLYLLHQSGMTVILPVESAEVRPNPLRADGFNMNYVSDELSVLFLRTENFDAVILRDRT